MVVATFAERLAQKTFPQRLGDMSLRYEASVFVAETSRQPGSVRPLVLALLAFVLFGASVFSFVFGWSLLASLVLVTATAACAFLQTLVARKERQQRRFVIHFEAQTLRLDTPTPWLALSRTRTVCFDDVKALGVVQLALRQKALTVDVKADSGATLLVRELLVADVGPHEQEAFEQVYAFLANAFGVDNLQADQSPSSDHFEA